MHLSRLSDIVFSAGLILPAFRLRMWATGRERTAGREGRRGGKRGIGERRKSNLEAPSEKPSKKRKLICKIKGKRQFGQIKAKNLKREQGTKHTEEEE